MKHLTIITLTALSLSVSAYASVPRISDVQGAITLIDETGAPESLQGVYNFVKGKTGNSKLNCYSNFCHDQSGKKYVVKVNTYGQMYID